MSRCARCGAHPGDDHHELCLRAGSKAADVTVNAEWLAELTRERLELLAQRDALLEALEAIKAKGLATQDGSPEYRCGYIAALAQKAIDKVRGGEG